MNLVKNTIFMMYFHFFSMKAVVTFALYDKKIIFLWITHKGGILVCFVGIISRKTPLPSYKTIPLQK